MIAVFLCIPWVASDAQKQDWGNLKRYAEANKELVRKGKQKDRVVFMGNSRGCTKRQQSYIKVSLFYSLLFCYKKNSPTVFKVRLSLSLVNLTPTR